MSFFDTVIEYAYRTDFVSEYNLQTKRAFKLPEILFEDDLDHHLNEDFWKFAVFVKKTVYDSL